MMRVSDQWDSTHGGGAPVRMTVHQQWAIGQAEITIWRPTRHTWGAKVVIDGEHYINTEATSLAGLIESLSWV